MPCRVFPPEAVTLGTVFMGSCSQNCPRDGAVFKVGAESGSDTYRAVSHIKNERAGHHGDVKRRLETHA